MTVTARRLRRREALSFDRGDYLLAQQTSSWKIVNSLWVALVLLGCGCLSFAGWIWAALLAQTRRAWIAAAVWTGVSVVAITLVGVLGGDAEEPAGALGTTVAMVYLAAWAAQVVHAFVVMKLVLKERLLAQDKKSAARQAYMSGMAPSPAQSQQPHAPQMDDDLGEFYSEPRPTEQMSSGDRTPERHHSPSASGVETAGQPIDVNAATADELLRVHPLDQRTVDSVLAARQRRGGFRNLDDLVAAAGLQPHQMVALRNAVTFGPFDPPEPPRASGRVLDL